MANEPRRALSPGEFLVLREIQGFWGAQNTQDLVFFTSQGDAALFVRAGDGTSPLMVNLTNLASWRDQGAMTLEELRDELRGPHEV